MQIASFSKYRAAGILPLSRCPHTNVPLVLLGREASRGRGKKYRNAWSDFGGKIEASDDGVLSTAVRELAEETYDVLNAHNCIEEPIGSGWIPSGFYALFAMRVDYVELPRFVDAMETAHGAGLKLSKDDFVWLPLDDLKHATTQSSADVYAPPSSPCITALGEHSTIFLHRFFRVSLRVVLNDLDENFI